MTLGGQRPITKVVGNVLDRIWALPANKISLTAREDVLMILTSFTKEPTKIIAPTPEAALPVVLLLSLTIRLLILVDQHHPTAVAHPHEDLQLQMM
jgi:hypothetical protein